MKNNLISKLSILINEGANKEIVEPLEEILIESISEAIKEDSFYNLPTNEILSIIRKTQIKDINLL